ncbi:ephrin-B2 [Nematostella vectensis]|uniref:ephrin-B2 n=1 Tax=Nematostella vectensis TaxID=45351 RepID=UPI0020773C47|nr:ephrin-B2 [Nematostella vectensis]
MAYGKDSGWSALFLVMLALVHSAKSVVYPSIYWTPRNPMFSQLVTPTAMNVAAMSKVKIVCPNPTSIVDKVQDDTPKEFLYENLWIVTEESYDKCNTTLSPRNKILLKCDTPLSLKYYTVAFQQFSATAQGLEFALGQEYYFIATSDGTKSSLDKTSGGNCIKSNMRMKFYICKSPQDPRCLPPTTAPPTTPSGCPTVPSTTQTPLPPKTNPTTEPTESNEVPLLPTENSHTKSSLQSDDPKPTLRPSMAPAVTSIRPQVTKYSSQTEKEAIVREEPCSHDDGIRPSWSIIIPLLIIIVLLIATNVFFVYQLKQIYTAKDSNICESLDRRSERSKFTLASIGLGRRKDEASPVNV